MRRVAISQSNYIPWKGYFDLIASVDIFVLYDDMQYTKRDWRNRNRIKTPNGLRWLTIPVEVKGKYLQKINETVVSDTAWGRSHWGNLMQNYKHAPYFEEIASWLEPLYLDSVEQFISVVNRRFIKAICDYLGISTSIRDSSDFSLAEGKTERLLDLCLQLDATKYISGPSAKAYVDQDLFMDSKIELEWFDNSGYPEYPQQWGEFEHFVTILDLLFNVGSSAAEYMKFVK